VFELLLAIVKHSFQILCRFEVFCLASLQSLLCDFIEILYKNFKKINEVTILKKSMALFFAITGVLLLIAIPISLSFRQLWLVVLFSVLAVSFIGFGFVVKARLRKKQL
jgi:hypothetical protein